eukprot:g11421.t1
MDEARAEVHKDNGTTDDHGRDWYVALCLGGMQAAVKADIERHVAACDQIAEVRMFNEDCGGAPVLFEGVHDGQAGVGKLLVQTDASPETLRSLRCVQALFALVAHAESLDIGLPTNPPGAGGGLLRNHESAAIPDSQERASEAAPATDSNCSEAALARLESLVTEAPLWPAAIKVWKRYRASETQRSVAASAADPVGVGSTRPREHVDLSRVAKEETSLDVGDVDVTRLKFRFSVVRDGRHPFGSVEASPRLGGAVWSVNPGWTVDLKQYDVEVVAVILERSVVVGLALDGDRTKRCSNGRIPREDKGFIETGTRISSLRPSTAYLMLCLAKPTAGDVVVDCMCGVGTIPFLGASWFPDVFLFGGDVDDNAIDHLLRNSRAARQTASGTARAAGAAAACAWDAQCLPLRDSSVDAMVVDMPFGKTCGTPRQNAKLYPLVMAEMARVLRPGSGRCVLLVAQPHLLGLPGIRRDNVKDRKKQRKKQRERECDAESLDRSSGGAEEVSSLEEHARSEKRGHGEAIPRQAASSGGANGASLGDADEVTGSDTKKNKQVPPDVSRHSASPALTKASNAYPQAVGKASVVDAAPRPLWRIGARHPVNVGGLISHLLVLERTSEPPPLPRSGRRKRLVGVDAYCKHRKEDQG